MLRVMRSDRTDLYRVLQVDPSANPLVIQAAYRALAQIFHPDVSGDAEEMKRINAAWEVLGDPRRRREYDIERAGRHTPEPPMPGNPGRTEDHAGPPVGPASGSVLRFGRYEGWTIDQVARVDPPFLEWLRSAPLGRALKPEIDVALRRADGARRMGLGTTAPASASTHDQRVHSWAPRAPTRVR